METLISAGVFVCLALVISALVIRLRLPWFVGIPIAGFTASALFAVIDMVVSGTSDTFVWIGVFFGSLYGAAVAAIFYLGRLIVRRISAAKTVGD